MATRKQASATPGGRPTKFTPERGRAICERLRLGGTKEAASVASGITYMTFNRWLKEGRASSKSKRADIQALATFAEDVEQAEAECEMRYTTILAQNANGYEKIVTKTITRTVYHTERVFGTNGKISKEVITPMSVTDMEVIKSNERDTKMAVEWLKRRRTEWKDNVNIELDNEIAGLVAQLAGISKEEAAG